MQGKQVKATDLGTAIHASADKAARLLTFDLAGSPGFLDLLAHGQFPLSISHFILLLLPLLLLFLLSYILLFPFSSYSSSIFSSWLPLLESLSSVVDVSSLPFVLFPRISVYGLADHVFLHPPVSGLSAAHTVYLNGGNVLVLDKQGMLSHKNLPLSDPYSDSLSLLRWQLHQSHFRYQRCSHPYPNRPRHRRQCEDFLRRYPQIRQR